MLLKKYGVEYDNASRIFLPLGMLFSAVAILLDRLGSNIPIISFLGGIFSGIGVAFLITGLAFIRPSKCKPKNSSKNDEE